MSPLEVFFPESLAISTEGVWPGRAAEPTVSKEERTLSMDFFNWSSKQVISTSQPAFLSLTVIFFSVSEVMGLQLLNNIMRMLRNTYNNYIVFTYCAR